jgi:hypothetical protein
MSKNIWMFFIISLFVLFGVSNFVKAADVGTIVNTSSALVEAGSNFFGGTSGTGVNLAAKWAYLGQEWKTNLMKNQIISAMDSFFQSINFVFVILFAVDYSLSLAVSFIIILWFYFFFASHNLLKLTSIFSKWVCLLVSFGLTIILAQVGLFSMIVNFIIQLFFGDKTWWMKLILGAGIVLGLILLLALIMNFGKQASENKKKRKDEENRIKLETGAKISEAMSHAFKK